MTNKYIEVDWDEKSGQVNWVRIKRGDGKTLTSFSVHEAETMIKEYQKTMKKVGVVRKRCINKHAKKFKKTTTTIYSESGRQWIGVLNNEGVITEAWLFHEGFVDPRERIGAINRRRDLSQYPGACVINTPKNIHPNNQFKVLMKHRCRPSAHHLKLYNVPWSKFRIKSTNKVKWYYAATMKDAMLIAEEAHDLLKLTYDDDKYHHFLII